jgi:diguanylate cyclase (GGDEF)-like protein
LILPDTGGEDAAKLAERIRGAVSNWHFTCGEPLKRVQLTISLGVGTFSEDAEDAAKLVDMADQALYKAKVGGRNMVVLAKGTGRGATWRRACV